MAEDEGCMFVEYTVIAIVHMIYSYYDDVILVHYIIQETTCSNDFISLPTKHLLGDNHPGSSSSWHM